MVLTLSRASWLTYPLSATLLTLLVYRDRLFTRTSLLVFGLLAIVGGDRRRLCRTADLGAADRR